MIYKEYTPDSYLSDHVKCFWTLECDDIAEGVPREKILPDGCIELIFNYRDQYRRFIDNEAFLQPRSFIHGQLKKYIEIGPTRQTGIIGVRFKPHGVASFLEMPVNELTEQEVGIYELFGLAGTELEDRLMNASANEERIRLLSSFLQSRLATVPCFKKQMMAHAVRQIGLSNGSYPVQLLAKDLNIGERQLERIFLQQIGITPKALSKITRFQSIFQELQWGKVTTLTAVAQNNGYYDQAHFIRDFRGYAGESPLQFFSGNNQLSDLFTGLTN